ncbi:MAG: hypothetical protein GY716_13295, partial [bacterium]|nr:hypothetical protein [bacterium]
MAFSHSLTTTWICLAVAVPAAAQSRQAPTLTREHVHDTGFIANTHTTEEIVISFTVHAKDARWMRLYFDDVQLAGDVLAGTGSVLRVTSWLDGDVQTMNAIHVEQWRSSTAYFNGDMLQVEVIAQPGTGHNRVVTRAYDMGPAVSEQASQCGPTDDRLPSTDPRAARTLPSGCSSWMADDCGHCFFTAGHCTDGSGITVVQFNVPPSQPNGSIVNPPASDQYSVDASSMQTNGGQGAGNDWGYFGVFPNPNTGLTPFEAQGAAYGLIAPPPVGGGNEIRITGYGVDSGVRNKVQQTHVGPLVTNSGTTVRYVTDTEPANSGSVVIWEQMDMAVAIHGHGGCSTDGSGSNAGTSILHPGVQGALNAPTGVCLVGLSDVSAPSNLTAGTPTDVSVTVNGTTAPGSVLLHFRLSAGAFTQVAMTSVGGGVFAAQLPGVPCGGSIDYYYSADFQSCGLLTAPSGAPGSFFTAVVLNVIASDDLEAPSGWTAGVAGDNATTGVWERVNPIGTAAQPEDDHTPAPGTLCFVTGQQPAGGTVGSNDVDGGSTTLVSPTLDLTGTNDPRIGYWRWYSNDQNASIDDTFVVDITDDGSIWRNVEVVGPGGPGTSGGWIFHDFRVLDIPGMSLTNQVQVRFVASDLGSGSIVEAGVDDLGIVDATVCDGIGTAYCPAVVNSSGNAAEISATGSIAVADNDVTLATTGMPPGEFGYYLTSQTQGLVMQPGGSSGNLCLGGTIGRYIQDVQNTGVTGSFELVIDLTSLPLTPPV